MHLVSTSPTARGLAMLWRLNPLKPARRPRKVRSWGSQATRHQLVTKKQAIFGAFRRSWYAEKQDKQRVLGC
jgi:hypothetical protein